MLELFYRKHNPTPSQSLQWSSGTTFNHPITEAISTRNWEGFLCTQEFKEPSQHQRHMGLHPLWYDGLFDPKGSLCGACVFCLETMPSSQGTTWRLRRFMSLCWKRARGMLACPRGRGIFGILGLERARRDCYIPTEQRQTNLLQ